MYAVGSIGYFLNCKRVTFVAWFFFKEELTGSLGTYFN